MRPDLAAHPPSPPVAGLLLAGGRSSRMGQDKALLPFGADPLALRAYHLLEAVCSEVVVLRDPALGFPVAHARRVSDRFPGCGPLEGLASGLEAIEAERALVLACDMPFVPLELLRYLLAVYPAADAVIPESPQGLEPMLAVYAQRVLPVLREQLARGARRMLDLFTVIEPQRVPHEALRQFDPSDRAFWNLNSPESYRSALNSLAAEGISEGILEE